jgi:hypothetical protein
MNAQQTRDQPNSVGDLFHRPGKNDILRPARIPNAAWSRTPMQLLSLLPPLLTVLVLLTLSEATTAQPSSGAAPAANTSPVPGVNQTSRVLKNGNGDFIGSSTILFGRSHLLATEHKAVLDKLPQTMKEAVLKMTSDLAHPSGVEIIYDVNGMVQAVIPADLPNAQEQRDDAIRRLNESGVITPAPPKAVPPQPGSPGLIMGDNEREPGGFGGPSGSDAPGGGPGAGAGAVGGFPAGGAGTSGLSNCPDDSGPNNPGKIVVCGTKGY